MNKTYSKEQDKWIKANTNNYSYDDLTKKFNSKFNENRTKSGLIHRCHRLGVYSYVNYQHIYTKEQDEWLKQNYENNQIKETQLKFNEKFNLNLSYMAINVHCCKYLKLRANTINLFTEEEKEWLRINYPLSKGKKDIHKKFCEKFGTSHSANSVSSMCSTILKLKRLTDREKWEMEHGKIPENCMLADLGNGEKMVMEKSINHYLCKTGKNKQGELTKTLYEITKAQRIIGKVAGKSIVINPTHNLENWLLTHERFNPPKKLDETQRQQAKELRKSGMSYKKIGEIFGVTGDTIANYVKGYLWERKNNERI